MQDQVGREHEPRATGAAPRRDSGREDARRKRVWICCSDVGPLGDEIDAGRVDIQIAQCPLALRAQVQHQPHNPSSSEGREVTTQRSSRVRIEMVCGFDTLPLQGQADKVEPIRSTTMPDQRKSEGEGMAGRQIAIDPRNTLERREVPATFVPVRGGVRAKLRLDPRCARVHSREIEGDSDGMVDRRKAAGKRADRHLPTSGRLSITGFYAVLMNSAPIDHRYTVHPGEWVCAAACRACRRRRRSWPKTTIVGQRLSKHPRARRAEAPTPRPASGLRPGLGGGTISTQTG